MSDKAAFDYKQTEAMLSAAGIDIGAAECHGFLCGQLCRADSVDESAWRGCLFPEALAETELAACQICLRKLTDHARVEMEAADMSFIPLLPADVAGIAVRVDALAGWCRAFLEGLGSTGIQDTELSPGSLEILIDLARITRASGEGEVEDEATEEALMQLVEYVRICALSLHHEFRIAGHRPRQPPAR
jgi:uncharacterized protein YgfB (UPF0149 family)